MTSTILRTLTCATTLMLVTACGRDEARVAADTLANTTGMSSGMNGGMAGGTSGGTLANDAGTAGTTGTATAGEVDVEEITLGRSVGTDGKISDKTDEFRATDEIVAVVETDDDASGQELVARWTYRETEQLVEEQRQTVAAGDDARTTFRLKKSSAWPAGKYTLRILHNGREVRSSDFSVK
jgi:hypothetical protein